MDYDNIYILNEKQKYLYEKIVEKQYQNIKLVIFNDKRINITINEIDFYNNILYSSNETFNIFNFMLFENLSHEIKEKIYIIDTLKSIYEGKCIEDIGNMKRNIEKFCKQNNLENKQYKEFTITIENNNLSLHDRTRKRELYLNYTGPLQ